VSKLFCYDFIVENRQGKQNVIADVLSRCDEDTMAARAISSPSFGMFNALLDELTTHHRALQLFRGRVFLPYAPSLWP
jgi:hypothetical protein